MLDVKLDVVVLLIHVGTSPNALTAAVLQLWV
jgi:hypothetical protein